MEFHYIASLRRCQGIILRFRGLWASFLLSFCTSHKRAALHSECGSHFLFIPAMIPFTINCSLAASRRGQFVTHYVEPPTSFGPLDRNCDSNCSLSTSLFVGRGHDPADQVGQSSSIFVQNRPISGKTRRSCNVTLRRGHDPALQRDCAINYNLISTTGRGAQGVFDVRRTA